MKDPVGLKYFRFQEGEFFILQMLDGDTSLDEIKDAFEAEFPPDKITRRGDCSTSSARCTAAG